MNRWGKIRARGVPKVVAGMNKTEAAYAEHLLLRQHAGEVVWFAFEAVKLRLADKTFYTPDFAVMLADGTIEQHEVKGFMYDDAAVKIKVAASLYPFVFRLIRMPRKGQWDITLVSENCAISTAMAPMNKASSIAAAL